MDMTFHQVEMVGVLCIITADFYQIDGYDLSSGSVYAKGSGWRGGVLCIIIADFIR